MCGASHVVLWGIVSHSIHDQVGIGHHSTDFIDGKLNHLSLRLVQIEDKSEDSKIGRRTRRFTLLGCRCGRLVGER